MFDLVLGVVLLKAVYPQGPLRHSQWCVDLRLSSSVWGVFLVLFHPLNLVRDPGQLTVCLQQLLKYG